VYCKGHNLDHAFESALPDGTAQLQIAVGEGGREHIANSREVQRLQKAWLMGINDVPVTYRLPEAQRTIYVRFKPGGLYAFTKVHQVELNNVVIDSKFIFGPSFEILWEAVASSKCPAEMISHVEDFFMKRLNAAIPTTPLVSYMLDEFHLPLTQLAKRTGYSAKYLTKTFQKFIGVGPKNFQRIQRFKASISYLNQVPGRIDWAEIVFRHGYHDQAHFIKDFKNFSGLSPQNYLSVGASCTRYIHTSLPLEHVPQTRY
jgi:AraC-like DNA-binding protein